MMRFLFFIYLMLPSQALTSGTYLLPPDVSFTEELSEESDEKSNTIQETEKTQEITDRDGQTDATEEDIDDK